MSSKYKVLQAPVDQGLDAEFKAFAKEHGFNTAEAIRFCLVFTLNHHGYDAKDSLPGRGKYDRQKQCRD